MLRRLKIAPTILDLATVSEGEDVLQLAKGFRQRLLSLSGYMRVHTYTLYLYAKRQHTSPHSLAGLSTDVARECRPENDFASLCQRRPPNTEVVVGGMKERLLLSFA